MHLDTPATENAERHATKLTKRYLAKPFWVLLVPFLFPSTLAAEPSLAETVQYIEAKILTRYRHHVPTFRLSGRNVIYSHHLQNNRRIKYTDTFTLDSLSTTIEVVPIDNHPDKVEIVAYCSHSRCVSHNRSMLDSKEIIEIESTAGHISFLIFRRDAERVRKALTHAIKLSGGKDELF